MKQIIILFLAASLLATSCMTIQGKKHIVLVEAPKNVNVNYNGEMVLTEDVTAFREEMGNTKTLYKYEGVKIKAKRTNVLDFQSGDKKGTVTLKGKPAIGLLIFEGFFTFGIGTIVDLVTGSFWKINNRFVDVPAALDNKTPRTSRELKDAVRKSY